MLITASSIKIFFRFKRSEHGKPKIKNTISFKRLNFIYCLGLICSAVMHVSCLENSSKDSYIAHFTVTLVINTMLFTLVVADKEARAFFKQKFQSWMEENAIDLHNLNVFKTKLKVGPLGNLDLEVGQEVNKSVVVPFHPDIGM